MKMLPEWKGKDLAGKRAMCFFFLKKKKSFVG